MSNSIIDRIQKLLRLAGNAGSEHEASLAAERAADLMKRHEIDTAEISLDAQEPRIAEPINKAYQVTDTRKKVAWHMRVINGVARSYGARAYWTRGSVMLFGRLSAIQAVSYTAQYLMREIESITDNEAPSSAGYSRAYRNAFRLGCAARIAARLDEKTAKAAPKNCHADAKSAPVAASDDPPPASAGVIAIIEKDRAEVAQAYADFSRKWGSGVRVGQVSSGAGYGAGHAAGGRVKLGGGRGGLKAGQGTLK